MRLTYRLDSKSDNYDRNAVEHRISDHVMVSEVVDLCAKSVDKSFASVDVAVQPNYAIGVFKDQ